MHGQTVEAPEIHTNKSFDERILYRSISDNGQWAVAEVRPDYDGGKVINLNDWSYKTITELNEAGESGRPLDVTDDGSIVVGAYGHQERPEPAVWRRATGKWEKLPYPDNRYNAGYAVAVTPDGHWAVGRVYGAANPWTEKAALWDLEKWEFVELAGLPAPQIDSYNQLHHRFNAISPDGRYLVAELHSGGGTLYDREEERCYNPTGTLTDGRSVRVTVTDMSPSCRYLHGHASVSGKAPEDSPYATDSWSSECILDMTDKTVTLLRESGLADHMTWGVADDGTLYAGVGGNGTPMRDFHLYTNGYWYPLDQLLKQSYGIDYYSTTQLSNTGTPYALSADGRTFASFTDPNQGEGWVMKFHESLSDAASRVDLMGSYNTDPAPGASTSSISTVRIGFDRNIDFIGTAGNVKLLDGNGELLGAALGASTDLNILSITFRRKKQGAGEGYRLHIPAGAICMSGTPSLLTRDIDIEYHGRADEPVKMSAEAQTESTLRCLDYTSNYLSIPFESEIKLATDAKGVLLRDEDSGKIADLNLGIGTDGRTLLIYSTATIPLYRYSDYRISIPAGSFTDPGQASTTSNEELSFLIHGNWEDAPEDENVIMSENFDHGLGNKFLFWEGDHRQPTAAMAGWGFEADTTPWWIARDDVYSSDFAAVSHSSYADGGAADDWMVIKRLRVPDTSCHLRFDSQSYLEGMPDTLSVYVIPSEKMWNVLTAEAMEEFRRDRELIYSERQSPGAEQEILEGDWRHNDVSLGAYAGQNVYIAFVNENKGGSAIFVDNVSVERDLTFSLALSGQPTVVGAESASISGTLYLNSDNLTITDMELRLLDERNLPVSSVSLPDGTTLTKETPFKFRFPEELPLAAGSLNDYSIEVNAGEHSTRFERQMANLLFAPRKRAVLEEYSGAACPNCPDGLIVLEKLEADFGDQIIPMAIRSYLGDELTPENSDYADLLGLSQLGAPSAAVNRHYGGYPVERASDGTISYRTGGVEAGLWYDFVADELARTSYAEIQAGVPLNENDTEPSALRIDSKLRFALDCDGADYSLFAVLLEDGVTTYQQNGRHASTDPFFGPWGAGGIYGKEYVYPYYINDVVRSVSDANLVGRSGLIPSTLKAGESIEQTLSVSIPRRGIKLENSKVAVMLIDNKTGYVENAVVVKVGDTSGIANETLRGEAPIVKITNGCLTVESFEEANVAVYDLQGRLLSSEKGTHVELRGIEPGIVALTITQTKNSTTHRRVIRIK